MVDAGQRSVLFLDIMRQRGDQYREHVAQTAPHVLSYAAELIIDGRKLEQPVNYALVRIIPPKGVEIDLNAGRSSWSIPVPATAPASAASRPTARSGSP